MVARRRYQCEAASLKVEESDKGVAARLETEPVSIPAATMASSVSSLVLHLIVLVVALHTTYGQFKCPDSKYHQYPDQTQCDKYYECDEGVATSKLCPDGLVFDPTNKKINKCDQPFNVDCGDRLELQEPQGNHLCPRKNGFFAHPDEKICNVFYNCIEGESIESTCPVGLHFDEYSGTCVWPESAGRTNCGEENQMVLKDGFKCPKDAQASARGQAVAHPVYAHPEDCQKFYVCLNGITPREQGCPLGEVYNEESQRCDSPENVPGCEDWFKDNPEVAAMKAAAQAKANAAANAASRKQQQQQLRSRK